jgi:hypothetical protein
MFDTVGAFKKQFTRVEGGYIVYPSRKVGGKLVSDEEYHSLVKRWERVAGRAGTWRAVGAILLAVVIGTLLSDLLAAPDWTESLMIALIVLALSAWLFWASTAPRRLVRDRAPVTAPRPAADARREARAMLNWRVVGFGLFISAAVFFGSVTADERTVRTWVWLIGSGSMLGLYAWIAFEKLVDGRG